MANFEPAFEKMIRLEGGYKLHTVAGDRGGMTYAGIARNFNPQWEGWRFIDAGQTPPTQLVREFYRQNYWVPIRGDEIEDQRVATSLFSFAVNTSAPGRPVVAAKLAQTVVGATPDGTIGPKTIEALNNTDPDKFISNFTLAKIARYREIVSRNPSQLKFLVGWINRAFKEAEE